ncbi:hypothetical protein [Brevundimonas sp. R86498]|uniref:hypothetical protein n=1 Tax=Brevundimonas sp. R86498 TaxID=3093845 RepID=UPI0037CBA580
MSDDPTSPRFLRARRTLSRVVVVIYSLVLPVALLSIGGAIYTLRVSDQPWHQWAWIFGSAGVALVLGWRLWLNARALGWTAPQLGIKRILIVWTPLVLLALLGLLLIACGALWIAVPHFVADKASADAIATPITIAGIIAVFIGGLLCGPAVLVLRRRRSGSTAEPEA